MAKINQKKQKLSITPNPSPAIPIKKPKKSKKKNPSRKSESKPENIQKQLESYSKEKLIDLVIDSALLNPTLITKIQAFADSGISQRKIFIHGLCWSTTNESLIAEFSQFGEIENCNLVMDKATGKAKGYAFITFKSKKSALKALKQPKKVVNNRVVGCNFATGPSCSMQQDGKVGANVSGRKIFVNNVTSDVNPDRLRSFFASFGEIESGPTGLDPDTRKFKGYALFVYKTLEGAKKVLEEPRKVFEGRQLHCQKALEGDMIAGGAAGITTSVQAVPPVYAALASGQNMGLKAQAVPPVYAALASGQNVGLKAQNPPKASVNGGLLAQNPPKASVNGGLLAQNPNGSVNGWLLSQNPNASVNGGLMGLLALNAASLYGNPNAAAGLINVNPYGVYGQVSGGGVPMGMGMGMGVYNWMLGCYGLGGPGTMSGSAGSAGSSLSQSVMQGYWNAYPSTLTAPKTSYAAPPAVSGQPLR